MMLRFMVIFKTETTHGYFCTDYDHKGGINGAFPKRVHFVFNIGLIFTSVKQENMQT